jgi:transposase
MIGQRNRGQLEFMVCGSIRDLLPDDHVLVRVDGVLDLSWLRGLVEGLYADGFGRPGVEPEAALRLMLAGFLLGFVQDRRLMREAQVNLAIRWFAGFGLTERLPDHSSLTRIRQRWGEALFRTIFARVVQECQRAGLVAGDIVHMDASLIRANVSFDSLVTQHLDAVADADPDPEERLSRSSGKYKKLCATDPDATMATSSAGRHLVPSYKQHTAVDDRAGIVVDVEIVTGEESDAARMAERLDQITGTLGRVPGTVTADAGYGVGQVYAEMAARGIDPIIPHRPVTRRRGSSGYPMDRFKYDSLNDIVRCPRGKVLTPRSETPTGRWFRAETSACKTCPLRAACIPGTAATRRVHITKHYVVTLRARRRRLAWSAQDRALYTRHRWLVEGVHGLAKTLHGLHRAVRRGLTNMKIQALMTAIAINLKRMAKALFILLVSVWLFRETTKPQTE